MRIRVTTSIDVCSTPLQPDGTPASRAPPKGQWGERKILKSSDSRMPSFAPHQDSAASCFVAIQRPRKNSRLSAFLHGFSVVGNQTRNTSAQAGKASHHGAHHHSRSPHRLRDRTPASRSRFSTRSIIDPGHSPVNATRPLGTGTPRTQRDPYRPITTYDAYQTRLLTEMGYIPQTDTNERRHRRRAKRTQPRKKPALFPQISDQKARQKVYGCLLSGALLAVILTICTLLTSYPPHTILIARRPCVSNLQCRPWRNFPHSFRFLSLSHRHHLQSLLDSTLYARIPTQEAVILQFSKALASPASGS